MAVACRRARPAAEVLLALAVWTMQGAAEAEQAGCSMLPVPGFVAVGVGRKLTASCRLRPMLANSFESCSAGCLSQEYCDAVTWFSHEHHVPALRGKCVRRTAGTDLILRNQSHSTSAFRRCSYQSCGLQRQMDAWCAAAQAVPTNVPSSTECMARNVRVLKSSAEDFTFQCVPVPSLHAPLAMACVDDRGHSLPCRTDTSNAKSCAQSSQGELHDMHRRGCGGLPTCLATPGMGPPSPPLATMHHHLHSVREAAAGQKVQHGDRRLPTWRSKLVGGTHNTVSWWLGTGDAGGDPFDADAFLELLSRFSANPEEPPSVQRRPATVFFVGDSTARQQAVSLCCLLHAGLGATGSPFSVEVTVNNPFMTFACQVARRAPGVQPILAKIRYGRSNRGGSLSSWRPLELTPVLDHELAHAIAQTPDVLILNLGAWTFEDGCRDMHSLHDELCNGTRPWVLHEYAQLWTLLAGALNGAYTPQKRRHSLVLLRTASPRDFEGGKAGVGTCRRTAPIPKGELEEQEERVDLSGMRASVLTKNLILDAVAAQRMPWVRVLDAYEISRARADAHPSRFNPRGEDCLHYCLPGIPDVYNGRLLAILGEVEMSTGGNRMGAGADSPAGSQPQSSIGAPGNVLRLFNFRYGDLPFVDIAKLTAAHGLQPETHASRNRPYTSLSLRFDPTLTATMLVECPSSLGTEEGVKHAQGNGSFGECSDLEHFSVV